MPPSRPQRTRARHGHHHCPRLRCSCSLQATRKHAQTRANAPGKHVQQAAEQAGEGDEITRMWRAGRKVLPLSDRREHLHLLQAQLCSPTASSSPDRGSRGPAAAPAEPPVRTPVSCKHFYGTPKSGRTQGLRPGSILVRYLRNRSVSLLASPDAGGDAQRLFHSPL